MGDTCQTEKGGHSANQEGGTPVKPNKQSRNPGGPRKKEEEHQSRDPREKENEQSRDPRGPRTRKEKQQSRDPREKENK